MYNPNAAFTLPNSPHAPLRTTVGATAFALLCAPLPVSTQPTLPSSEDLHATTSEQIALLSVNALIGGVTAGIFRLAHGDNIGQALTDSFLRGAIGAGLAYAGKRVAVSDFDGAGLLGREIAALGVSTAANAADAIGAFDRLMFPLGPLPGRLVVTRNGVPTPLARCSI